MVNNSITVDTNISSLSKVDSDDLFNRLYPRLAMSLYKKDPPSNISGNNVNTIYERLNAKRKSEGGGRANKRQRQTAAENNN